MTRNEDEVQALVDEARERAEASARRLIAEALADERGRVMRAMKTLDLDERTRTKVKNIVCAVAE